VGIGPTSPTESTRLLVCAHGVSIYQIVDLQCPKFSQVKNTEYNKNLLVLRFLMIAY
jgi:hypothetical protein